MSAFVGHTSMQLAFLQCLQTSLIISHAWPPAMGVGLNTTPLLSGTCSMNCTCLQFCASSWPVLSYESAVNFAGSPCSWFHSLHATSNALQPMQIDVSVKKPIGRSWNAAMTLKPHQIARDLRVAALGGDKIERQRDELVDDRNGARLPALIDRDQVAPADLAGVDAQVREKVDVGQDRHLCAGRLTARRAGHAAQHPLVRAARAHQLARTREQRLAGLTEDRELRQAAAARAMPIVGLADAKCRGENGERLEHGRGARAREKGIR